MTMTYDKLLYVYIRDTLNLDFVEIYNQTKFFNPNANKRETRIFMKKERKKNFSSILFEMVLLQSLYSAANIRYDLILFVFASGNRIQTYAHRIHM